MTPPNTVTLLRILLTPVFIALLFSNDYFNIQFALLVFTIAAITDWYDGLLARRYGYISRFGKFFDPLADKILTSFAFGAFYFLNLTELWMVVLIISRDILITLLRMYLDYKNKQFDTSSFSKTKTVFQMLAIYLILFSYVVNTNPYYFGLIGEQTNLILTQFNLQILMWITTILTLATGIFYLIKNRKSISSIFK
ncbi:MAG: CDP-diacylglycerol--glycerol-3-phosphate 3-phosphatidyltransferase [Bacteroidetes bacterium]|nr:CDP-diacylglycerol--glycerol-3-phosphate 3-phosphatidyltransferase [Bacteroidota bacterium]